MKNIFTAFLFLFSTLSIFGQNGSIKGKVISDQGYPISNANVLISGTNIGINTDISGDFQIDNLAPKTYKLKISYVGYKGKNIEAKVFSNQVTTVATIELKEVNESLDEVVLKANKTNKFYKPESTVVSKLPLKDLENPQVYNTIPSQLLSEQVVTNFDNALKNVPGLYKLWESTGRGADGSGYYSLRGFAVQPTMINGLPGLTNGTPDPANIESVEVIKGPSGTLYGSSLISYGGLININTKRPYFDKFGGNVSYTAGSYGLNRVTADVNTLLSTEKNIALRINSAYHTQNSFQDAGFKKSFYIAPSLAYEVNDRLSFFINTEFYNGKNTNQTMLFLDRASELRVHNMDELGYNNNRSYTSNDLYVNNPTYSLQGEMRYKISDNWTSQTVFSRSNAKSDGYYSYLYEITNTVNQQAPINDGIILSRYTSKQNSETLGTDIQQNFIGEFNLGNFKNKMVAGLDFFNQKVINNGTGYGNQGYVYIGSNNEEFQAVLPALHEQSGTPMGTSYPDDSGVLTQAGADAGIAQLANPGAQYSESEQKIYSAYVSDVIYFMPELSAMASVRLDHFSNDAHDQTAFSPKFGLIYQPILDKVSVFANYMNGFTNVAPVTVITDGDQSTQTLDPEHANQFEFGTKLNLFNNKLAATISYYDIEVSNRALRIDIDADNYYYNQEGKQSSKGFETSITANPIEGLNIVAGYSYNDSNLEEGDAAFENRRPEGAGPQNLANLWASYRFQNISLKGFGVGFGGNYADENMIFNRNVLGTFTLPSYTIINASIFYETEDFGITLKLDNIANEEYYGGWSTINPQTPRTLSANFTYNF
ncbi:TonB-dependent receptor [Galbibacter sp. PAP.153]|uniref:TonB-dependent receptor n=1 Tax=Galbibacter sp. PAP.153 TaxID=3104623 RepID=UPI00300B4FB6